MDGFGRSLQSKQRVESGLAIERDEAGAVVIDDRGIPQQVETTERWLVSGHIVYNNKQQPVRQYEPFYSGIPDFESDAVLRAYGVSTLSHYDPVGRLMREDLPNGTFTKVETTPWAVRQYDPNDTVQESFYRTLREVLPDDHPEKQALRKAQAHADTPSIVKLDPLGQEIIQLETGENGIERITETGFDSQGNILSITDARGLEAFRYWRDMQGRVLYEHSIDAGETWSLPDALDQLIHHWDGRGTHQQMEYDSLGRTTSVFVEGAGLNQVVERFVYGEDSSVSLSELKNARGRLVQHYDSAGILTIHQYSPDGNPLRSERQLVELTANYSVEPDWTDPSGVALAPDAIFTSEATYDALGRVKTQQLADETSRRMTYLQGGGLHQLRVTTADGRLDDVAFLEDSSFNARGQRTGSVLGNSVILTYTYDAETFRMTHLSAELPRNGGGNSARRLQNIAYTYDAVGNLTHYVDLAQQSESVSPYLFQGLRVSSHCDFTYDAFYQLKQATGRVHQGLLAHDYRPGLPLPAMKGTQHLTFNNGAAVERYWRTYEYDLAGNIRNIDHNSDSRTWNREMWISSTSNRSLPAKDANGIPVPDPESRFDANGNCISMPHLRAMDWNYRNQMSRAVIIDRSDTGQPDDAEYYVYGGDGVRVRKIYQRLVNGDVEITEKIYLDGCEIKRIRRENDILLERITSHITDGTNRIALLHQWTIDQHRTETDDVNQKKIHYQLSNHLGSSSLEVAQEVAQNSAIISYEEYFPFGGTAFIAGNNVREVKLKDYRYSGKERDDATGFYCYEYRYYAPWIGNWLSPDPLGPEDSLNLYQFVLNNPINLVDPNGLQTKKTVSFEYREFEFAWQKFWQLELQKPEAAKKYPEYFEAYQREGPEAAKEILRGWRVDFVERVSGLETLEQMLDIAREHEQPIYVYDPRVKISDEPSQESTLAPPVEEEVEGETVTQETVEVPQPPQEKEAPNVTKADSNSANRTSAKDTETPKIDKPSQRGGKGQGPADKPPGGQSSGGERGLGTQTGKDSGESLTPPDGGGGKGNYQPPPPPSSGKGMTGDKGSQTPPPPPGYRPPPLGGKPPKTGEYQPGDDPNGSPDGTPGGTRTSGPVEGGSLHGTSTGKLGGGEEKREGIQESFMDMLTRWMGYLNLEFGGDETGLVSGGIPGGQGSYQGIGGQIIYTIVTILSFALGFGLGKLIGKAIALGMRGLLKISLRGLLKKLISLFKNWWAAKHSIEIAVGRGAMWWFPIHMAWKAKGSWLHAHGLKPLFHLSRPLYSIKNYGWRGWLRGLIEPQRISSEGIKDWFVKVSPKTLSVPALFPSLANVGKGKFVLSCVTSTWNAWSRANLHIPNLGFGSLIYYLFSDDQE